MRSERTDILKNIAGNLIWVASALEVLDNLDVKKEEIETATDDTIYKAIEFLNVTLLALLKPKKRKVTKRAIDDAIRDMLYIDFACSEDLYNYMLKNMHDHNSK